MRARISTVLLRSTCSSISGRSQFLQRRAFSARACLYQHGTEQARFPGAEGATFTSTLKLLNPKEAGPIPCYRVMNSEGTIVDESYTRDFSDEEAVKLYENMVAISIMDLICIDAQRQGKNIRIYNLRKRLIVMKVEYHSNWLLLAR